MILSDYLKNLMLGNVQNSQHAITLNGQVYAIADSVQIEYLNGALAVVFKLNGEAICQIDAPVRFDDGDTLNFGGCRALVPIEIR